MSDSCGVDPITEMRGKQNGKCAFQSTNCVCYWEVGGGTGEEERSVIDKYLDEVSKGRIQSSILKVMGVAVGGEEREIFEWSKRV